MGFARFIFRKSVLGILVPAFSLAQGIIPQMPTAPSANAFPQYSTIPFSKTSSNSKAIPANPFPNSQQQQNANIIADVDRQIANRQVSQEAQSDIEEMHAKMSVRYTLPTFGNQNGTKFYYDAFNNIRQLDSLFSLKKTNFQVENAYFENKLDKEKFEATIKNGADFIKAKMKEQGYDLNSNTAKNFMLFQFFTEPLKLKSTKQEHLPFKYDFDDYMGVKNYSKMFVSKLIETGSGQCHSMPLLYMMLADEIGAEAYLALSPNHSYIRFPDDKGKWYNIELTNGMFSTTSYILQSGYIKSEALQNKVYMQNLSKKEMLAGVLVDLASGYVHKFGYDEFVAEVIKKALELSPNNLNAHMVKASLDSVRFEFVMKQLAINPQDNKELQRIRRYQKAVQLLNEVNKEYDLIDGLGYEPMPDEAYQAWLQSMKKEERKQENEAISKQLKQVLPKKLKP